MHITILDKLTGVPNIPVMAKEEFLRSRSSKYGYLTDGKNFLPYFIDEKFIFKYMVFSNLPIPKSENNDSEFLLNCIDYIKQHRLCDFIFQPLSHCVVPFEIPGARNKKWSTPIISLDKTYDEIYNGFHSKHRYEIRKAQKIPYEIREISVIELFQLLESNTQNNPNYTFPSLQRLLRIKENLKEDALLYGVKAQDEIVAGALILKDSAAAYYVYGGSRKGTIGWMHLLQSEIIKALIDMKIQKYDLVGLRPSEGEDIKYKGLEMFKLRFSPQLITGYTFWLPIKKFKVRLFRAALSVRKTILKKEFNLW